MEYILETEKLSKFYGGKKALENVNMHIEKGSVYGLIGENGAGKTTIMKIIVGLAKQTRGDINLFGSKYLDEGRKKIGCVIENPAIYGNMTAIQNLETFRRLVGDNRPDIVNEILNTVGLKDTGKKKVKNFSLGMKQRLSIGIALLGEPEFLILDEPINGLDPTGIAEVRELILKLNTERHMTIMISSHILGELFKVATCFGVISKGNLIDEFSSSELENRCKKSLRIEVDDEAKAQEIITGKFGIKDYNIIGKTITTKEQLENRAEINKALCDAGVKVSELALDGKGLEEYFVDLMRGGDK